MSEAVHLELLLAIQNRQQEIKDWIAENAPQVWKEQKHLDEKTEERAYWHFGYICALTDILNKATAKRKYVSLDLEPYQ
jgi:hypothetical protein